MLTLLTDMAQKRIPMEQAEIVRRAIEAVRAICEEPPSETIHESEPRPSLSPVADAWPPASLDAERRFGQPHAKLFPFIGRKVRTPNGAGVLIQVFADSRNRSARFRASARRPEAN